MLRRLTHPPRFDDVGVDIRYCTEVFRWAFLASTLDGRTGQVLSLEDELPWSRVERLAGSRGHFSDRAVPVEADSRDCQKLPLPFAEQTFCWCEIWCFCSDVVRGVTLCRRVIVVRRFEGTRYPRFQCLRDQPLKLMAVRFFETSAKGWQNDEAPHLRTLEFSHVLSLSCACSFTVH
jgi:hypothetical protein